MEKLNEAEAKPFFKALLLQFLAKGKNSLMNSYPYNRKMILDCWQEIVDKKNIVFYIVNLISPLPEPQFVTVRVFLTEKEAIDFIDEAKPITKNKNVYTTLQGTKYILFKREIVDGKSGN